MIRCICPRLRSYTVDSTKLLSSWEHIHTFSCFLFNVCNDKRWPVKNWNVHNAR